MARGGGIPGVPLALVAAGGVLVFSGVENTTVGDTLRSLAKGQKPVPGGSEFAPIQTTGSGGGGGSGSGNAPPGTGTAGSNTHNLIEIGKYMHANGYSRAAAAGIAGCVAGESGGDPESVGSGGNGLIGWTPPKPGIVTGNPTRDLNVQLPMIIEYNNAQGADLIAQLNAISNPVSAADFYSEKFERPLVTNSDVRPAVALLVYGAI